MHKIFLIITLLVSAVLAVSSCCDKPAVVADPVDKYDSMECIDPLEGFVVERMGPPRGLLEDFTVELTGMVEVNETGLVYIVVDPESKSRRSYLVTGARKSSVAALKGKVITVKCCYLEKRTWSGTVRVYGILSPAK